MSSHRHPIYIISKGRWELRYTARALESMDTEYRIVIEPQEYDQYASVIEPQKILVLPFSNLGQGSIPARNWVWDHAKAGGHSHHWILDDNIQWFGRMHQNKKLRVTSDVCFTVVEDLVARYSNVPLAGLQYEMFTPALQSFPPLIINTRIYSCILIQNDIPFRWRGRYNEDTDLSLRILKAGYCTLLCQAFVCKKLTTMKCKGGNTDELYVGDGRLRMAESLKNQHPEIVMIKRKWGRWQHHVDYKPFRSNKLLLREGITIPDAPNNYGLRIGKRAAKK